MAFWDRITSLFGRSKLLELIVNSNTGAAIYPDLKATYYTSTYTSNSDVFSVIEKIAGPASRVPIIQVDRKSFEENPGRGIELLSKPNPMMSIDEFIYAALVTRLIYGEMFITADRPEFGLNAGKPVRLDLLPPQWVELEIGTFKEPITGYKLMLGNEEVKYSFEDVMHLKNYNPDFQLSGEHLRGLSRLRPLLKAAMASSSGYDSMVRAFQNQGAYGLLTILGVKEKDNTYSDKPTTANQLSALKNMWQNEYAGNANRGKMAVTNKSVEWTNFGLSPVDLNILKSLGVSMGKICDAYDYPYELISGSDSKTYNNYQEAMKAAWNNAIIPQLDSLCQKLSDWLLPALGEEQTMFVADYDAIPALQADKKQLIEWLIRARLTSNEIRDALGYDPVQLTNMDIPLVEMGLTRVDEIGMMPDPGVSEGALREEKDYRL